MIDDLLRAVNDLFGNNEMLASVVAAGLCASAVLWIVNHLMDARGDIERRVNAAPIGEEAAPLPPSGARETLGGLVTQMAGAAGQTDWERSRVLRSKLIQAGYYDRQAVVWFFGARVGSAVLFGILGLALSLSMASESNAPVAAIFTLCGVAMGFVAPSFALDRRIARLQREHSSGFPDFMDLLIVCVQAGLSMEAGINRIAGEIGVGYPSLCRNLELTAREIRSGKPLAMAIDSLAQRLGINEAKSFSTLLQQSEELGSSISQSLRTYADDMRNKRMMKAEEKAYALPAKLVIPLTLFVFPTLLIVLMLPVVISVSNANM